MAATIKRDLWFPVLCASQHSDASRTCSSRLRFRAPSTARALFCPTHPYSLSLVPDGHVGTRRSIWKEPSFATRTSAGKWSFGPLFRKIEDEYESLAQVQQALRQSGLESSNLIVAVDFTKSNEWAGLQSNNNQCLHHLGPVPNPYEQAISVIAKTLAPFDDDGLIPAFGFGDATTKDVAVFNFSSSGSPAKGLDSLLGRYRELVPHVKLAGPTSFAPVIQQAMEIVQESGNEYHILVIIADGQVTGMQERATINAIVSASALPLSIIMVGVGDGPWDVMQDFDDKLPNRRWDNFQFVNFTDIAARYADDPRHLEAMFAMKALMEVPEQYKIIQKQRLIGSDVRRQTEVACLKPPGPFFKLW